MEQLGIGVISGIIAGFITSVVLFLITRIWRYHFIPWIEDKIYQDIRVDGSWSIMDNDDEGESLYSQQETLELEQRASRLSGRLILVPKEREKMKPRTLRVEGIIRDRFVIISCIPATRRDLGYQVFLGEVSGDGTRLQGQASYYHIEDADVQPVAAGYAREDSAV
ncbi:MAG: hypothetical protein GX448_18610 [Planctomycetes bacterium]|nr:hypothetical protein [Planctomycetota bacterium]